MKRLNFTLFFLFNLYFLGIMTATDVSGPSFSDVTWSESGSPYNLVGDFQIPTGVTLTIEQNVVVNFDSNYEILIKGNIIINGSKNNPVIFNGNSSGSAMLMFKSTDLSNSSISYAEFNGPKNTIQLAEETEHNQDNIKNSGILEVDNISLMNSKIQTNGYSTTAKMEISDSYISNSIIRGDYPRSESIKIVNCIIENSTVESDSYNYGISMFGGEISNSSLMIGCCGANISIDDVLLENCSIYEGGGSPVNGPLSIANCTINELDINLPAAKVNFDRVTINNNNSKIKVGNGTFKYSKIYGDGDGVGLEFTGYNGYSLGGNSEVTSSEITDFGTGIKISNINSLTIKNSNVYSNTSYNVYNASSKNISADNNYWGYDDISLIRDKIYDYYKNINNGQILINEYSIEPNVFDVATNFDNQLAAPSVRFYPNPVSDFLFIESEEVDPFSFSVFSISGGIVKTGEVMNFNNKIDLRNIQSGVYLISIYNENFRHSFKIVKK